MPFRIRLPLLFFAAGLLLVLRPAGAAGQDLRDFPVVDSLTRALVEQQQWRALDSVGRAALAAGADYPALRRRLGYGALVTRHPSRALRHYGRALRANPVDTVARYGLTLAHLALGQREAAGYYAAALPDTARDLLHLGPGLQEVSVLGGGQTTTTVRRHPAGFLRAGLVARLSPRLTLTQSVGYFGQQVELLALDRRRWELDTQRIRQTDYQLLLSARLAPAWLVKAGYHHASCRVGATAYFNDLGYAAVAYSRPLYTLQLGAYAGQLTDTARVQTDLRATVYPLGDLRLYVFGRGSLLWTAGATPRPNAALGVGVRLRPWCWVEVSGVAGPVPVLAEADGAAVYNLLDPLQRRAGATAYFVASPHWQVRVAYGAEQRRAVGTAAVYDLYELTTGIVWNW